MLSVMFYIRSKYEHHNTSIKMILEHQEEITQIENCPTSNDRRSLKLYRYALEIPMKQEELQPYAIRFPERYSKECLGWGLSFNSNLDDMKASIAIGSKKNKRKYKAIYSISIDDTIAVKHQSTATQSHYTVYPAKGINLISMFTLEK